MNLYLVQHGEAKSKAENPARPLTDRGVEVVRRMATWSARVPLSVEEIRHSGKTRAAQTAELFAELLTPPNGVKAVTGLDPMDEVGPVAAALDDTDRSLMLVGHLPFMSRLAAHLLVGDPEQTVVSFRNAGVVCLSRGDDGWQVRWAVAPDLLPGETR